MKSAPTDNDPPTDDSGIYVRRHLQLAWWSILFFLTLGAVLEGLHIFQVEWYLRGAFETRRLMWTLGHVHGTLLGLVHAFYAASLFAMPTQCLQWRWLASPLLIASSVVLPGGFFLSGVTIHGGDPGTAVFLVPVGALMLFVAVLLIAISLTSK